MVYDLFIIFLTLHEVMFSEYSINGYLFILFLTLVVIVHLSLEIYFHKRRLNAIKYRIHVNGTRGKSSVARLIASGLRGGEVSTVCKTTGTMARFIAPNGVEEPVLRVGRTNIMEQVKVIKKASLYHPDALVIECMAVQPLLQSLCELKLVRATHGVLCNARADHLDVMGPTEHDVALALAATVPIKGKFYTPEKKHLQVFVDAAVDRGSDLIKVTDVDIEAITDEEISRFSYAEYKENVALALKVCEACDVRREDALQGMWEAKPDPGALIIRTIDYKGKKVTFANGFAANDPLSTGQLWRKVIDLYPDVDKTFALVNCRDDRGDRSRQMAEVIGNWNRLDSVVAIGSGTEIFLKNLPEGFQSELNNAEGHSVSEVLDLITKSDQELHVLAIGVCNIAKIGFGLLNYFLEKENVE